jgi:hypothetical protein
MKPLIPISEWEIRRFSDPSLTIISFFGVIVYGLPTAFIAGKTLVEGWRQGVWIVFVWGGLVTLFCLYFLWLHTWCVRTLNARGGP